MNNPDHGQECVTVLVIDRNQYYAAGLRMLIYEYMRCHGDKVIFLDGREFLGTADMIFMSMASLQETMCYESISSLPKGCLFIIKDRYHPIGTGPAWLKLSSGILGRWECIENVSHLMGLFFLNKNVNNHVATKIDHYSKRFFLTPREKEVLRNLALGMNNHDISHQIGISEKTVSTHKRAAMRKLNISRNTELHYWLLNGGLKNVSVSNPQ
ncbi:response regulator transcription factor [Serratia proteamaculans]|uniref:helix-turn-helix transcriptional regulator n=1 Tax=Serratia proteamaculans TaxID=28151 RepID=UPI0039AEF86E